MEKDSRDLFCQQITSVGFGGLVCFIEGLRDTGVTSHEDWGRKCLTIFLCALGQLAVVHALGGMEGNVWPCVA